MPLKLTTSEIRKKWIDFWQSKNHFFIEPKSLIPKNDNSLLWINSGVATLKKYFSGEVNPPSAKLVNCQKAIRTNDIENVGNTSRHHTFFEMLGNFSIGDYFKKEAIFWAFELLTKVYRFDKEKLYFTIFKDDKEALELWLSLGIDQSHILLCGRDRNFWDVGNGPCGPCTEIYYDRGPKYDVSNKGAELFTKDIENDRYVEIWNIVFSQFNNDGNNSYSELTRKNIDTGAGLERLASIIQDTPTDFEIDIFMPLIRTIEKFTNYKYVINAYFSNNKTQKEINRLFRIIVDHIKACCFAIADGVIPSNKERGYIIRRLIRRALVCCYELSINLQESQFFISLIEQIISIMSDFYPYLLESKQLIVQTIINEKNNFIKTIAAGYKLLDTICVNNKNLTANQVFTLFDTYGFPIELTKEIASKKNVTIDAKGFNILLQKHREISRSNQNIKAMALQNSNLLNFNLPSTFIYDDLETTGKIIGIFDHGFNRLNSVPNNQKVWIVLDKTVLYATSGGQIFDKGWLVINNVKYELLDCFKGPNLQNYHLIKTNNSNNFTINSTVTSIVDQKYRHIISAHHSAEHLLQHCLQLVIDKNIKQEGSNKTFEKLEFDFHYHKKLSNEQIILIEKQINSWINDDIKVLTELLTLDEAKSKNAQAHFENVYAKIKTKLRVVSIGDISCEICGGTHVKSLKEIEQFRIIKLSSKGSGCWRLEAIATNDLINKEIKNRNIELMSKISCWTDNIKKFLPSKDLDNFKLNILQYKNAQNWEELLSNQQKIADLEVEYNKIEKQFNKLNSDIIIESNFVKISSNINNQKHYCLEMINQINKNNLNKLSIKLVNNFIDHCFILLNLFADKIIYIIIKKSDDNQLLSANDLILQINALVNGKGGGNKTYAQGSCCNNKENINKISNLINSLNK